MIVVVVVKTDTRDDHYFRELVLKSWDWVLLIWQKMRDEETDCFSSDATKKDAINDREDDH